MIFDFFFVFIEWVFCEWFIVIDNDNFIYLMFDSLLILISLLYV